MASSSPGPLPQRLRIESAEQPGSIFKGVLLALPFLLAGLFMRGHVSATDAWAPWLFILIGAGWILYFLWLGYGRYRYGAAYLEVDMPVLLGQNLSARLVIPERVSARRLSADLTCRRVRWQVDPGGRESDSASRSRSLMEEVLWSKEAQFPILNNNARSEGHIRLQLPGDKPVTDQPAGPYDNLRPGHFWELKIDVVEPGVNFQRRFRFPVTTR